MPLYRIGTDKTVLQIKPTSFSKERDIQKLFEANLETLFGVRFIASEFTTGDRQRGRIDTLGVDQDGYPTIIEYKKTSKENVINQGLFYLDWLVDHKGDFTLAAQQACGAEIKIDWSRPRLILVAESFSDYDKYAVNRIGANIELWTFRRYGEDLLHLDPLFVTTTQPSRGATVLMTKEPDTERAVEDQEEAPVYTIEDHTRNKSAEVIDLFERFRERILGLAEEGEIIEKSNKMYIGYKHGKNFCEVRIQASGLKIWLDIPIAELDDPLRLARDVSKLGHYGTGQVELKLTRADDLDKIVALAEQSYQQTI